MADLGRAWIEGRVVPLAEARVPVTDRGFLLGDGVFDTVRTCGGRPFLLGDHLDRLRRSCGALAMPTPWSDADLVGVVEALLRGWPADREAVLRVVVTRGDGGHGLALPEPQVPRLLALCRPLPRWPERARTEGIGLARPRESRWKDTAVPAHVKSSNYLAGVLALADAQQRGAAEALLRAPDGTWAEATTSNLFVVRDGRLHTPGIEHVLPGITRRLAIAATRADGLEVHEGPVDDETLRAADEVFITSSVKEVVPVVRLDEAAVGDGRPGPTTRRVIHLFAAAVQRIQGLGAQRISEVFEA